MPSGPSAPVLPDDAVIVIGAGIVGLSIALRLQMDGKQVTVIDRQQPMSGCSAGNAGYLSQANIFPPASRDVMRRLPGLLLSRQGPLVIRPSYLPRLVPWGIRALRASAAPECDRIARSMAAMMAKSLASFDDLLAAASAGHLIDRKGSLVVFKSEAALAAKAGLLPVWNSLGICAERIPAGEVRELEPALAKNLSGGIFFSGAARCLNPRAVGMMYFRELLQSGGTFTGGHARAISLGPASASVRLSDGRELHAKKLVVCTGFEAEPLQSLLDFRLPMASERGYHLMLPAPGIELNRPIAFGEPMFGAVSMQEGLRLAGTAEFAFPEAPAAMERARMLLPLSRAFIPQVDGRDAMPWMGVRPTLPDGMPAIGALTSHPAVLYALGHGHNGLTTSAITARCISDLVSGRPPTIDLRPFAIERFSNRSSTYPGTQ